MDKRKKLRKERNCSRKPSGKKGAPPTTFTGEGRGASVRKREETGRGEKAA